MAWESPDEIALKAWAGEIAKRRALLNDEERGAFDLVANAYPQDESNLRLSLYQLAAILGDKT